ncbi:MAG: hypothetical protein JWM02_3522 [Frankiales bacterium]|nr:hypothetical protein [Frankiales bacterium]
MRTSRRKFVLVAVGTLAFSTFSGLSASTASADGRHGNLLKEDLVGSNPAPASPVIAGIQPGGAPWVNGESTVRVRSDGRIKVRIRGLVIPIAPFNGTNPVTSAVATLVCSDVVADSTEPFALDAAGNGRTRDVVTVPSGCHDPVVLIQPAGNRAVYIASTTDDDEDDD